MNKWSRAKKVVDNRGRVWLVFNRDYKLVTN